MGRRVSGGSGPSAAGDGGRGSGGKRTRPEGADPLHDLDLLLRSRYGLIVLDTAEEERAGTLLAHLADRRGLPLFTWTRTKGLRRTGARDGGDRAGRVDGTNRTEKAVYGTAEPAGALAHVESARFPALYHFRGLGPFLEDRVLVAMLGDAAAPYTEVEGALVLTGPGIEPPQSLRAAAARVSLPPPELEEFRALLRHVLRDVNRRSGSVRVDLTPEEEGRMLRSLQGLTLMEAEKVLTRAVVEDGRLSPEDLETVAGAKRRILEREGLLEYTPAEESMAEVADLAVLKQWLRKRQALLREPERAEEFGLPFPRGVLLLGVPGCGKSLCAKAVATEWGLPLLRLDPSTLYNKYIGESEKNFRRAMETAERMAPCILFVDELEKALAGAEDRDAGVSQRILGGFLTWLQERRGDVFVVATANDVSRLPPELLRKGRFDEIFFVDLPDRATRREVFRIHLAGRGRDPGAFDLGALADATEGFSGSEVEQVVVAALYTAFSADAPLTTATLMEEAAATRPLSETMAERVAELRAWADGRTVLAN